VATTAARLISGAATTTNRSQVRCNIYHAPLVVNVVPSVTAAVSKPTAPYFRKTRHQATFLFVVANPPFLIPVRADNQRRASNSATDILNALAIFYRVSRVGRCFAASMREILLRIIPTAVES
jgi:hypothetical protein